MKGERQQGRIAAESSPGITPETTIIDVLSRYRQTEAIFKRLEAETGECICCQGLFLSLRDAAKLFGYPMGTVLAELNAVIGNGDESL